MVVGLISGGKNIFKRRDYDCRHFFVVEIFDTFRRVFDNLLEVFRFNFGVACVPMLYKLFG